MFLKKYDRIKIPKLNININKNYKEIIGEKITRNSNGIEFTILNALQTIDLKLDEKGGKIKSEAALKVKRETCSYNPINISERLFHFDNTFYMFLLEDKKHKPYFAMRVNDINLFN